MEKISIAFVGLTIFGIALGMAIAHASPGKFRSIGREALPVGDPEFDRAAQVAGESATGFAFLGRKARKTFRAARWPAQANRLR